MRLNEIKQKKRGRAGIYPVYTDSEGQVWVCLMIPSDPAYGGPQPQMGKGRIDDGQTAQEAAIREGEEELGLRRSNMSNVQLLEEKIISGLNSSYTIFVYTCEVTDPKAFDKPHYESSWAGFLLIDDAIQRTRTQQRPFLEAVKAKYEV